MDKGVWLQLLFLFQVLSQFAGVLYAERLIKRFSPKSKT
jgi:hypothetical protein